jgi:hypothetical protein
MQDSGAIIERVRRISAGVQRLDVAVERSQREIAPGQLFLARSTDQYEPYLREPWLPVARQPAGLVIERPASQSYTPGQVISLLGPVGRPIPLRDSIRALLLIAYESTPAALLLLAQSVLERGGAVTLALIGAAQAYANEALPPEIEVVRATSTETWTDQLKALTWAEQVVAIAPPGGDLPSYTRLLENIRKARLEPAPSYAYGLFHPPMPCGVGACQACVVRQINGEEMTACTDGPAFDLLALSLVQTAPVAGRGGEL